MAKKQEKQAIKEDKRVKKAQNEKTKAEMSDSVTQATNVLTSNLEPYIIKTVEEHLNKNAAATAQSQ